MVLRLENLDAKEISFKKLPAAKILCALQQKKNNNNKKKKKDEKMNHSRQK